MYLLKDRSSDYLTDIEPRSITLTQGTLVGWTCCRVVKKIKPLGYVIDEKALHKDCKGCHQAGKETAQSCTYV